MNRFKETKCTNEITLGRTKVSIRKSNLSGVIDAQEIKGNEILYRINLDNDKYIWLSSKHFEIIK